MIATRWLNDCITQHPICLEQAAATTWLPSRLTDVGLSGTIHQPHLVLRSEIETGLNTGYLTLSHLWASTHVERLTSQNLDSFRQRLPMESLSRTVLDAMTAAQCFGVRYLWIDSLCIIQDSLADWQAESTEMGNIYRHGICNIVATGSSDNGRGLFQARDSSWVSPRKGAHTL
jgi:hypothetical protein